MYKKLPQVWTSTEKNTNFYLALQNGLDSWPLDCAHQFKHKAKDPTVRKKGAWTTPKLRACDRLQNCPNQLQ